jgi:hypothetical protein
MAGAQMADNWKVWNRFGGLQLYLEETNLPEDQALKAQNIQFRKVGTISALEGLTYWSGDSIGGDSRPWTFPTYPLGAQVSFPAKGLGFINDRVNDADIMLAACSTLFLNTAGGSKLFTRADGQDPGGEWQMWDDSTRVQDTLRVGDHYSSMAAALWRADWLIETTTVPPGDTWDTIDYIFDNSTIFCKTAVGSAATDLADHESMSDRIRPQIPDIEAHVAIVNLSIGAVPMLLALQAGMEPVLFDGTSGDNLRWFGVADSGRIGSIEIADTNKGYGYVVDNAKLGVYGENEIARAGYWLHIPGPHYDDAHEPNRFNPVDSTFRGAIFRVDSNKTDTNTAGLYEFQIWFTTADTNLYWPARDSGWNEWGYVEQNKQYLLHSAPLLRVVVDEDEAIEADVVGGGRTLRMDSATAPIKVGQFDHSPHYLEMQPDSLHSAIVDTSIWCVRIPFCEALGVPCWYCDTTYVDINGGKWDTRHSALAGLDMLWPIRTTWPDTANDSLILIQQGSIPERDAPTFTLEEWRILRATIPYASHGIVYLDRLYLAGDPQFPNIIAFSQKSFIGPQLGAFPIANIIQIPSNGDSFVGFALIYDWLVVFQNYHTWILKGDPDAGFELELALPDEGCIAIETIRADENRVTYLSHKGWRVFDGNTARDFAQAIKPAMQGFPRETYKVNQAYKSKSAAGYDPNTGNYWLSQPFGSDTANSGSWIYNAVANAFSYSDEVYGSLIRSVPYDDTTVMVFTDPLQNGAFRYGWQDSLDLLGVDRDSMEQVYSTGWDDFESPQQRKYISDGSLLAKLSAPVVEGSARKFFIKFYRDFDTLAFDSGTVDVWGTVSSVHYEDYHFLRFQPTKDFVFLRTELQGYGLNVMDVQRVSLRYHLGGDLIRTRTYRVRP